MLSWAEKESTRLWVGSRLRKEGINHPEKQQVKVLVKEHSKFIQSKNLKSNNKKPHHTEQPLILKPKLKDPNHKSPALTLPKEHQRDPHVIKPAAQILINPPSRSPSIKTQTNNVAKLSHTIRPKWYFHW